MRIGYHTRSVSLDRSFESLCDEFRGQLAKRSFYEFASVVQALRPWKDLVRDLLEGPVTQVNLHSNPDDPPDAALVCESTGKTASVEHTDFDNSMHAHARHLHLTPLERMTFLPPLYEQEQLSRAETIKLLLNPPPKIDRGNKRSFWLGQEMVLVSSLTAVSPRIGLKHFWGADVFYSLINWAKTEQLGGSFAVLPRECQD